MMDIVELQLVVAVVISLILYEKTVTLPNNSTSSVVNELIPLKIPQQRFCLPTLSGSVVLVDPKISTKCSS